MIGAVRFITVCAAYWLRWVEGWYVLAPEQMDKLVAKPQPKPTVQSRQHNLVLGTQMSPDASITLPPRQRSATLLQFIQRQKAAGGDS